MSDIRCACLVALDKNRLLLVRVRNNQKWYLPGGKIEAGESAKQTLIRELAEELSIKIIPNSVHFLTKIVGPAYPQHGKVELICFNAAWQGEILPSAEISEVAFIEWNRRELLAPAVCQLCDEWLLHNEEKSNVL